MMDLNNIRSCHKTNIEIFSKRFMKLKQGIQHILISMICILMQRLYISFDKSSPIHNNSIFHID